MMTDGFTENIHISVYYLLTGVNYIADQLRGPGHPVSFEMPGTS